MFWLVDSAGARITDQVAALPGPAGRRAHLLQPGAAVRAGCPRSAACSGRQRRGRRLHPELLRHRVHGRGQRLDVPRVAAHGRGRDQRAGHPRGDGRRPHARHRLGLRRQPRRRRRRRHRPGQGLLHLPAGDVAGRRRPVYEPLPRRLARSPTTSSRPRSTSPSTSTSVIDALVDAESFFEVKPLFAPELVTGFALLDGRPVGIVANNPAAKGGVLFVDSADKAARFIWRCDAFNVPLVFLADVPGFMIGTEVERQGIIRHGAKMITAVSRGDRAEGLGDPPQGLRRRPLRHVGPGVRARGHHRPAHRQDRRHGPRAGGQRRLRQQDRRHRGPRRAGGVRRRAAPIYEEDVDLLRLASELVVDAVVQPGDAPRREVDRPARSGRGQGPRHFSERRHGVPPV